MKNSHSLLLALLLAAVLAVAQPASALSYAFRQAPFVCFMEEISHQDYAITGRYNWLSHPDKSISMELALFCPEGTLVTTKSMAPGEHTFQLSIDKPLLGSYRLCAQVTSPSFNPEAEPPLLVEFDVDQTKAAASKEPGHRGGVARVEPAVQREVVDGLSVFSFTDVGGQGKAVLQPLSVLLDLERELSELHDNIADVLNGLTIMLEREDRMRMTAESTFVRVWVCAFATILVTGACVWTQFRFLKATIVKKKLI